MNIYYIIIGIGTLFLLLTWMAFLDIARKKFSSFEKKLIWGVVVCIPFIGVVLYLIFGMRTGKVKA